MHGCARVCAVHLHFEGFDFLGSECVSLGNDWNDVDKIVKLLHEFYVQRLQPTERGGVCELGGGGGGDEREREVGRREGHYEGRRDGRR